eukprot:TRINITY_DN12258_c0_g1_i1.p1 TRINITY_DN12258_c0_g1~~TRINITY_DN12258_c0_g1_i1.p1  ORF type:complete len:290 (+),score=30.92 TRINITY_DN12258_c0_g1_i1:91-960(+)
MWLYLLFACLSPTIASSSAFTISLRGRNVTTYLTPTDLGPPNVTDGNNLHLKFDSHFYLAARPLPHSSNSKSDFFVFRPTGHRFSVTVDMRGAGCGCNMAMYLVSMPSAKPGQNHDYYCDANGVGGNWCPEFDLMEANVHGLHSTAHKCDTPWGPSTCVRGSSGSVGFGQGATDYGPNDEPVSTDPFTVDTSRPIRYSAAFGPAPARRTEVTLQNVPFRSKTNASASVTKIIPTTSVMASAFDDGMVLVVSYWASPNMHWLDHPPCPAGPEPMNCPSHVTVSDIRIEAV